MADDVNSIYIDESLMRSQNHVFQNNIDYDIQSQIEKAREECKLLYNQVNIIKGKLYDANLLSLSHNIAPVNNTNLKPVLTLKGHSNKVADFRWSEDSKTILSTSQDGFMITWDSTTGLKKNAIPLDSQWVLSCAISPNGNLVASAGLDNNCTIYRISHENRIQQNIISIFKGHTCYVSDIEFISDRNIITASGDMTCALWDIPKSKRVVEFSSHLGDVLAISLPPKETERHSNTFASGGSDGYIYIWDIRTPTSAQKFFVSDSDITALKFFKNGEAIITGSDDGIARLFDLRSDCKISEYSLSQSFKNSSFQDMKYLPSKMEYSSNFARPNSPNQYSPSVNIMDSSMLDNRGICSLDFSGSGRLLYTCYTEYGCVIWDTIKCEVVGKLDGHSNRLSGIKTSPDGLAVCTSSWDMTMKLWTPSYV